MESTHERPVKYVDISLILELFDQMEHNNLELANDSLFRIMTNIRSVRQKLLSSLGCINHSISNSTIFLYHRENQIS